MYLINIIKLTVIRVKRVLQSMDKKWLILGICGVTNGGKTTIAKKLLKLIPSAKIIAQDSYFLPQDSTKHISIPELNCFNWEVLTSLDMEKMKSDIEKILRNEDISTKQLIGDNNLVKIDKNSFLLEDLQLLKTKLKSYNILIIEGFCFFNYAPIEKMCDLKFYLTLDKETCYKRRIKRVYEPADVPGYFENVVWPEHLKHLAEVREKCENIVYLTQESKNHLQTIIKHLLSFI